jgi:hypothetical protein
MIKVGRLSSIPDGCFDFWSICALLSLRLNIGTTHSVCYASATLTHIEWCTLRLGTERDGINDLSKVARSCRILVRFCGSGLAYLETTTKEKFLSTDLTMEANRVTLLSFEVMSTIRMPHAGEQSFEVLDFE